MILKIGLCLEDKKSRWENPVRLGRFATFAGRLIRPWVKSFRGKQSLAELCPLAPKKSKSANNAFSGMGRGDCGLPVGEFDAGTCIGRSRTTCLLLIVFFACQDFGSQKTLVMSTVCFKMRGRLPSRVTTRSIVTKHFDGRGAHVDIGLDRQGSCPASAWARCRAAVVGHLGLFSSLRADAVPHELEDPRYTPLAIISSSIAHTGRPSGGHFVQWGNGQFERAFGSPQQTWISHRLNCRRALSSRYRRPKHLFTYADIEFHNIAILMRRVPPIAARLLIQGKNARCYLGKPR